MTKDDILKLKAVTLYILQKCGETDYIHLFKILYFAEREQYAHYGQHLVKDSFVAMWKGPVPSFLYDAIKALKETSHSDKENSDLLIIANVLSLNGTYSIIGKEEPDMDYLSMAEVRALDKYISLYKGKSSSYLSTLSHDEAWKAAYGFYHNSIISSEKIAKAGGATNGLLEYIKEQEMIDKILCD